MAVRTITLTGAEVAVTGLDGAHAHITNMGADIIYAAKTAGISAGADGVVPIPAGNGNTLRGISGAIYLLGTGSALIQTDDYVQHPSFRNSTASGGSGVDDVARAALSAHEGNAEIHVTAGEKSSWNSKAELSDIPSSLPANGGNSDTVGTKYAYQLDTLNVDGASHTSLGHGHEHDAVVQFDGSRFRLKVNSGIHTAVNYSDSAGDSDTIDGKHADQFVNYLGLCADTELLNNAKYNVSPYECTVSDVIAPNMGLSAWWWHIKFHCNPVDGAGYGVQIAYPLNNHGLCPKYRYSNGADWSNWKDFSDGGNAAMLESHPASDFVLKTDYDALAARVAALEGGTT